MTSSQAKREARRVARRNGHSLDRWQIEAGRPVAMCACGGYAAVMSQGSEFVYSTGRLRVSGARFVTDACTRS